MTKISTSAPAASARAGVLCADGRMVAIAFAVLLAACGGSAMSGTSGSAGQHAGGAGAGGAGGMTGAGGTSSSGAAGDGAAGTGGPACSAARRASRS